MEGFLQRSVTTPNWKLPSFTPGMERYRLRYWINRLPTFAELKRRGERRGDTCPRCFLTSESQLHSLVDCSANKAPLQRFRIKILRTMRSHLTIFPTQIRARDVCSLLLHRNIPCRIVNGWSLTTYDNHDRSKVHSYMEIGSSRSNNSPTFQLVYITSYHTPSQQRTP